MNFGAVLAFTLLVRADARAAGVQQFEPHRLHAEAGRQPLGTPEDQQLRILQTDLNQLEAEFESDSCPLLKDAKLSAMACEETKYQKLSHKFMSWFAKDKIAVATTAAKAVVWGTALGLSIAFPPATLAITAGVAALGFLISASAIVKREGLTGLKKLENWCDMFAEVGQNFVVGMTAGVGAVVPAIILGADLGEMLVTELHDSKGILDFALCPKLDMGSVFDNDKNKVLAEKLLKALPWGLSNGLQCPCSACDGSEYGVDEKEMCGDTSCHAAWHQHCFLDKQGEAAVCDLEYECEKYWNK